jgi:hypothetical protein
LEVEEEEATAGPWPGPLKLALELRVFVAPPLEEEVVVVLLLVLAAKAAGAAARRSSASAATAAAWRWQRAIVASRLAGWRALFLLVVDGSTLLLPLSLFGPVGVEGGFRGREEEG